MAVAALAAVFACGARAGASDGFGHTARFLDGSRISGRLVSLEEDGLRIRWRHPADEAEWAVETSALAMIFLNPLPAPEPLRARVHLDSGDALSGERIVMDGEALVLERADLGRLNIPRARVRSIEPQAGERAVLMDGPASGTGWAPVEGTVDPADENQMAAIVPRVHGGHTRSLRALPPFPAAWQLDALLAPERLAGEIGVSLFVGREEGGTREGLQIRIQGDRVVVMRSVFLEGQPQPIRLRTLGQSMLPARRASETRGIRITLSVCHASERMVLRVGDQPPVAMRDRSAGLTEAPAAWIMVEAPAEGSPVARLRITDWDGESEPAPLPLTGSTGFDAVEFTNGDLLAATVVSVDGGNVVLRTGLDELTIPLAAVSALYLASDSDVVPGYAPGAVRVSFGARDRITVMPERIAAGHFVGSNAVLGPLRIPVQSVHSLEFLREEAQP